MLGEGLLIAKEVQQFVTQGVVLLGVEIVRRLVVVEKAVDGGDLGQGEIPAGASQAVHAGKVACRPGTDEWIEANIVPPYRTPAERREERVAVGRKQERTAHFRWIAEQVRTGRL